MRVGRWIVGLAVLGPLLAHAQAANASAAESKLMAMEQIEKVQAPRTNDFKALDAMLDDSFVGVDPNGSVLGKTEILANLRTTDSLELVPNSMAVRIQGDAAIVTGLYQTRGVRRGKPFTQRGRFVDTWLYKSGRWVAISSLSTPIGAH